jgi:hypothetical protein
MLSRISSNANLAFSESIDRIAFDMRTHKGFETFAVGHVNASRKQLLDILDDSDILKQVHPSIGRDFNHNVDVAVGASSPRAREPNKAAWHTPCAFNAASFSRKRASMSWLSMASFYHNRPIPGGQNAPDICTSFCTGKALSVKALACKQNS